MTTYYSSFYPAESADGAKGSAAFLGAISTAIVYLYKRSATALTDADKPDGNVIYTFATANINSGSITNGWSETIPAGSDPLYVVAATATGTDTTDTIYTNEWSSPVIMASSGLNTATVYLFKRSTSSTAPSAPSTSLTYDFQTGVLSGTSDGWTQTAPDSSGGKYLFATTATAINSELVDTILATEWSEVIVLAENGDNGLTSYLTNEAHIVPATYDGTVTSYDGASGYFMIHDITSGNVAPNFTLSTLSNPQSLTVIYSANGYVISGGLDPAEDSATLTIRATGSGAYANILIDKVFTLSKSKAGADGSAAKLLSVYSDRQTINYSAAGDLSPATQTTTFNAIRQNTTSTVVWTIEDTLGNTISPVATYLSSTSGDTVTMTASQFNAAISLHGARGLIITGTAIDGITLVDKVTVVQVVDGSQGLPGDPAIVASLSNSSISVPSDHDGSNPVLTNANTTIYIYEGQVDVSAYWTASASPSTGVTGSLSGKTYTVTGLTVDSGYVDFTLTRSSWPTQYVRFNISKAKAGLDGTPATVYEVRPSVAAIRKDTNGIYTPSTITFTSYSTTGTSAPSPYLGRFIVSTSTDGITYTDRYTSSTNQSSYVYTLISGISHVKARLYLAGGTSTLVDEQVTPIVSDGSNGSNGTSAITGYITNESAVVWTYADGTPANFTNINGFLKILQGTADITSSATSFSATASGCTGTINTADNTPVNGQVKGYYQITAMSGDTATLTVSATYNGTTITKVFSLSKSKAGYEIVSTLPTTNLFQGRTVFLTTDNKLYRYTGSAWTKAVDGADLVANSVTTNSINAGAVTAAKISVTQLDALSATIGTLRTATTGARMEIHDNVVKVYDSNNIVRVQLGNLTI